MNFIWSYPAIVTRIVDGDSIEMEVSFSIDDTRKNISVRAEGINALELREKFGAEALAFAARLAPVGMKVTLIHRKRDQYGRLLAKIILENGEDFSTLMLTALASDGISHLAVPYLN